MINDSVSIFIFTTLKLSLPLYDEYVIYYFEKVVKYRPVTDVESNKNVVEAIPHTFPETALS